MRGSKPKRFTRVSGLKNIYLKPYRLIYPVILVGLIFLISQLIWGKFLTIKTIICTIDGKTCEANLLNQLNYLKETKLITFKPIPVSEKLKKTNPYFKDITFQIFYPDKLNVQITTQNDLIQMNLIKLETLSEVELLSPESTMSSTSTTYLRQIPYLDKSPFEQYLLTPQGELIGLQTGLQPSLEAYLLIENNLPNQNDLKNFYTLYHELYLSQLQSKKIWVYNSAAAIKLDQSALVIFSLKSDPRKAVASLQQIRSESTINFDQSIIDLRFTNGVVSKQNEINSQ